MTEEELPLCECGCGERVTKLGNRYILGHNARGVPHTTPAQIAADKLQSEKRRGVLHTPEHNAAVSAAKLGIPHTPEACAAISAGKLGVSTPHISPAQIAADDAQRGKPHTTPAQIASDEAKRGGNDIVQHHYIYDHSDLSKYTMKMTRSSHTRLHNLMRKAGIKIPHINES